MKSPTGRSMGGGSETAAPRPCLPKRGGEGAAVFWVGSWPFGLAHFVSGGGARERGGGGGEGVEWGGRDEGDEFVLIDRELFSCAGVGGVFRHEPVGKRGGDDGGGLAEIPTCESGPAFTRVIGDDEGKALVARACPEGRLAEAGMTDDG